MSKKNYFMSISLTILMFINWGCRKDNMSFLESDNNNYAILIQYEEEKTVFQVGSDGKSLSGAQLAFSSPVVTRQSIRIGINEDGTSEWVIREIKPKNPFDNSNDCPPDKSSKVNLTHIIGNSIFQFDENNNLLNSFPFNLPSFIELVNAVKKNGNKLDRKIYSTYFNNSGTHNNSKDGIVEVEPGLSLYSKIITESDSVESEWWGRKLYCYYETTTMSLLAQFILDNKDNLLSRKILKYNTDPNIIIPEITQEELYRTDEQGNNTVTKVIIQRDDIINSVNL